MAKNCIYSTLTASQNYAVYAENSGGFAKVRDIHINGGHGLTNRHGDILTGAVTEVTDEELELLCKDFTFKNHVRDGWIVIDSKKDVEKAISDLNLRDGAAPVAQEDLDEMAKDGTLPEEVKVMTKK